MKVITLITILLMSNTTLASDWELDLGGRYNYDSSAIYSGGNLKNTTTNASIDYDPIVTVGSGLGLSITAKKDLGKYYFFSSLTYNQAMKVEEVTDVALSTEPGDTTIQITVIDIGMGKQFKKFRFYGAVNYNQTEIKDNESDPYKFDTTPGIGYTLGIGWKFNEKHSVDLDMKFLNIGVNAKYSNYDIDYGRGDFITRGLVYRYNFGEIKSLFKRSQATTEAAAE